MTLQFRIQRKGESGDFRVQKRSLTGWRTIKQYGMRDRCEAVQYITERFGWDVQIHDGDWKTV